MSEKQILRALINDSKNDYDEVNASAAADAIIAAGFTMTTPADQAQNDRLDRIERKVDEIRGWTGLPGGADE